MKKLYTSVPANIKLIPSKDNSYCQSKNQYTMKTLLLPQATSTPTPEKAKTTQQNKNNGFNSAARLLMSLAILLGIQGMAFGQTTQYSASGTFVAPAGVTSVVVKAWGVVRVQASETAIQVVVVLVHMQLILHLLYQLEQPMMLLWVLEE